jgi:hypothetical protein
MGPSRTYNVSGRGLAGSRSGCWSHRVSTLLEDSASPRGRSSSIFVILCKGKLSSRGMILQYVLSTELHKMQFLSRYISHLLEATQILNRGNTWWAKWLSPTGLHGAGPSFRDPAGTAESLKCDAATGVATSSSWLGGALINKLSPISPSLPSTISLPFNSYISKQANSVSLCICHLHSTS